LKALPSAAVVSLLLRKAQGWRKVIMSTDKRGPETRPSRSEIADAAEAPTRYPDSECVADDDGGCNPEGPEATEDTSLCDEVDRIRDPAAEHPT
jgi:hypothetical protein